MQEHVNIRKYKALWLFSRSHYLHEYALFCINTLQKRYHIRTHEEDGGIVHRNILPLLNALMNVLSPSSPRIVFSSQIASDTASMK